MKPGFPKNDVKRNNWFNLFLFSPSINKRPNAKIQKNIKQVTLIRDYDICI